MGISKALLINKIRKFAKLTEYLFNHANHIYSSSGPDRYERGLKNVTYTCRTWWRHQMETFSALLAICAGYSSVSGEFPAQRPVTRSFDVFFDLRLHKRLSKQSWGWWFETLSRPLWRRCNESIIREDNHPDAYTYRCLRTSGVIITRQVDRLDRGDQVDRGNRGHQMDPMDLQGLVHREDQLDQTDQTDQLGPLQHQ